VPQPNNKLRAASSLLNKTMSGQLPTIGNALLQIRTTRAPAKTCAIP
jgi:hypothetical protein